ncbi:MAG: hypothetical protein ACFE9X_17405 [Promethearchaeota archaeon]
MIPINQGFSKFVSNEEFDNETMCYGFIVPYVERENETFETFINNEIRHMVNDFLREKIPVYWANNDFSATIRNTSSLEDVETSFEKGTFIVPFANDSYNDSKILAIIYDYNQSSEIEDHVIVPVYLLMVPLDVNAFELTEVKIVQLTTDISTGLSYYFEKAGKCGFLTFESLDFLEAKDKLNNSDFNVIICPAAVPGNWAGKFLSIIIKDLIYRYSTPIREFVANGGGFIGSCFGAYMASAGVLPIPVYMFGRAHNPNLRSFGVFSIADVFTSITLIPIVYANITIEDHTHPVTFGVDNLVRAFHYFGPKFMHVGKNSQAVANFKESNCRLQGSPAWVSSQFGNGKIMLFCDHPEMLDTDDSTILLDIDLSYETGTGKKIVSNSLFYTTSKSLADFDIVNSINLTFIDNIWTKTSNICFDEDSEIFSEIFESLNESFTILEELNKEAAQIVDLVFEYVNENDIDLNVSGDYLAAFITFYHKYDMELFRDYYNKTYDNLKMIEKIFVQVNNSDFYGKLQLFKDDLKQRLIKARAILLDIIEKSDECLELLIEFRDVKFLKNRQEKLIAEKIRDMYHNQEEGFFNIPQAYFNSLKFLREAWYNFEADKVFL